MRSECLTGADAHRTEAEDPAVFAGALDLEVTGFTIVEAYPWGGSEGGADAAGYEAVWGVKNADSDPDPVLGARVGFMFVEIYAVWRCEDSRE